MTEAPGSTPSGPNDRVDAEVDSFLRESAMLGTAAPRATEPPADLTPWGRSKMSQAEWSRALQSSDAQLKGATPGSEEFARLMEARLRMNMPPPTDLAFEDIERYAKAQVRSVMQDELARGAGKPPGAGWLRVVVGLLAIAFLATTGVLVSVILKRSESGAERAGGAAGAAIGVEPNAQSDDGAAARPDETERDAGTAIEPQAEPQARPDTETQIRGGPGASAAPLTSAAPTASPPLPTPPRPRPTSKPPKVDKPFFE